MVIITLIDRLKSIQRIVDDKTRWCYIGKDISRRQRIADLLGPEKRLYLKDMLHKIAEKTRDYYLDFVAQLGKRQSDQLNWWASKFASKSPFHTDFFLLVCYEILVTEFIRKKGDFDNAKLVIFVEDPWLFVEVKNLKLHNDIQFMGNPNLFLNKFLCVFRGIVYRVLLIGWFMAAWVLMRFYFRGRRPGILDTEKKAIGIVSSDEKPTFKNGKYEKDYLSGISTFYEENRIPFFYLFLFPFSLSMVRDIGGNREVLWPLVSDVTFFSALRRIFERWDPDLNNAELSTIDGVGVSYLLKREKWIAFSTVGFNFHLIQFDALNRFFSKKWCSHIIYLFENQPWEKMVCMSAIRNDVKTIGYQHSSISRLYLSQFIGKDEQSFVPLPHRIITAGGNSAQLYREGGMPDDKIVVGGAWRFRHLLNDEKNKIYAKKESSAKQIILVSLPFTGFILKSMVENLFYAFSHRNCLNGKVELWFKPHPLTQKPDLVIVNKLFPQCHVMHHRPFIELLNDAGIVIVSTSTAGLESFLYGKKVISYIPENFIALDPLLDITDERIYKWYEGEDFNVDFLKDFSSASNSRELEQTKRKYFSEIDHEIWLKSIDS